MKVRAPIHKNQVKRERREREGRKEKKERNERRKPQNVVGDKISFELVFLASKISATILYAAYQQPRRVFIVYF